MLKKGQTMELLCTDKKKEANENVWVFPDRNMPFLE